MFRPRILSALTVAAGIFLGAERAGAQTHYCNFDSLPTWSYWGQYNGVTPGSWIFTDGGADFYVTAPYSFYYGASIVPWMGMGGGNNLSMSFAGVVAKFEAKDSLYFKFSSGYEGTFEINGIPFGYTVEDIAGTGPITIPIGSLTLTVWSDYDPYSGLLIGEAIVEGIQDVVKVHWMGIEFQVDEVWAF